SKPRASLVHIVAPPPDSTEIARVGDALKRVMRTGAGVSWSAPQIKPSLEPPWEDPKPADREPLLPRGEEAWRKLAPITAEAVAARVMVQQGRREAALRKLGVKVVR